jgi:hypothetical protein
MEKHELSPDQRAQVAALEVEFDHQVARGGLIRAQRFRH